MESSIHKQRQALLPNWVRFFCWLFVVAALSVPVVQIYGLVEPSPMAIRFLGIEYEGRPLDPQALAVQALFVFFGIAAWGLLVSLDRRRAAWHENGKEHPV